MTLERKERMREVLSRRQPDLTVVFEHVHDHHNISACLRSCDAVGIQDVYIISQKGKMQSKLGKKSSASAAKWLTIHHFTDTDSCFRQLKKNGFSIYSTRLTNESIPLYDLNLTGKVALVFGNEHEGVSEKAASLSDGNFIIPQMGMIRSLNISVACAVSVYEACRQRMVKGFYKERRVNKSALDTLMNEWETKL